MINMENVKIERLLNRTAILIQQRKELEEKENALKKEVQEALVEEDLSTLSTPHITVTKVTKKTYTYSPDIQNIEKELKLKKSQEEIYGVAKETFKSHYMYVLSKQFVKDAYDDFGDI
jgi:methionyl-tRNA formyltransferase